MPDPSIASSTGTPPPGAEPQPRRRAWWRRVPVLVLLGVLLLLGVAYAGAYAAAGGKLARDTTVLDIPVGGLTPGQAEARLERELPEVLPETIPVTVGEESYEVVAADAGLTVDVPATVDRAPGGGSGPVSLARALLGAGAVEPVVEIDDAALASAVESIAEQFDSDPVDGSVGFRNGEPVAGPAEPGLTVDQQAAVDALSRAFPPTGEPVTIPARVVPPKVTQAEVDRAMAEFAEPAMSGPVTVRADGSSVAVPAADIGTALSMRADESSRLRPALDGKKLIEATEDELAELGQQARDATIEIRGGRPRVVPSRSGRGVDPQDLTERVLAALTETGRDRVAEVRLVEVDPELTTGQARRLGVREVTGEFTTYFPDTAYRNVNIGRASELIDNTLLLPGEVFSLNEVVGERTAANGFTTGGVISGGRLVEGLGGGVSQVATTVYNAAFFAGMEDVEHRPHSLYFRRYPEGREATVAWGSLDMAFKNNTPYGVVVDTVFQRSGGGRQGVLTVKIWSTDYWDVSTTTSGRSNFRQPGTVYDTSPDCEPQEPIAGFDVTVTRTLRRPGAEPIRETYHTSYNKLDRRICGPRP